MPFIPKTSPAVKQGWRCVGWLCFFPEPFSLPVVRTRHIELLYDGPIHAKQIGLRWHPRIALAT